MDDNFSFNKDEKMGVLDIGIHMFNPKITIVPLDKFLWNRYRMNIFGIMMFDAGLCGHYYE